MRRLTILTAFLLLLAPVSALAQTDAQTAILTPYVERITEDGFAIQTVRATLLGRIVITATNAESLREVVLHGRTGEVLRDRLYPLPPDTTKNDVTVGGQPPPEPNSSPPPPRENSGPRPPPPPRN